MAEGSSTGSLVALTGLLLLTGCVPWTVVPIEEEAAGPFDAKVYVDGIWESRVLAAEMEEKRGVVRRVNRESRSGRLEIELAGGEEVSILIGPVILGTALRDAVGVEFSDFTNQMDYAAVANELNDRVVREVLSKLDFDGIEGKTVVFAGAGNGAEIVPVRLEVE
ncbi:MAG: DUF2291 domain-containing protein [bacterium]|nr:DUF2291 domain-containing protein [bacterium]